MTPQQSYYNINKNCTQHIIIIYQKTQLSICFRNANHVGYQYFEMSNTIETTFLWDVNIVNISLNLLSNLFLSPSMCCIYILSFQAYGLCLVFRVIYTFFSFQTHGLCFFFRPTAYVWFVQTCGVCFFCWPNTCCIHIFLSYPSNICSSKHVLCYFSPIQNICFHFFLDSKHMLSTHKTVTKP